MDDLSHLTVELSDPRANRRIDLYLTDIYPEASRSYFQRRIESGDVLVDGQRVLKHHKLRHGDSMTIRWHNEPSDIPSEDIPLDVLYEDDDMLVLNKFAGIVVHPVPGEGGRSGTIVNALLHRLGSLSVIGGVERPGIVHRLDKDTSGVLIVAKNDTAMRSLQGIFERREITKTYLAVVSGIVRDQELSIESYIGRDPHDRERMTVRSPLQPRLARTHARVVRTIGDHWTLLEVDLLTGRTHQIRVHMASIGYPIAGDRVYGDPRANILAEKQYGLHRQWLHAWRVAFEMEEREYRIEAPLPEDLGRWG